MPITVQCQLCNNFFTKTPKDPKIFCSKLCANQRTKKTHTRTCKHCEKNFVLTNIAYERRGNGVYCSVNCRHQNTRLYTFDESYFETINNENKAYWLGFIFADGCNDGYSLHLHLSNLDETHLTKFQIDIQSNNNIKKSEKNKVKLTINSKKLCIDLKKIGCVERKTFVLEFPKKLKKKLIRHFIRGYFDGDGCIYKIKNRKNAGIVNIYSASPCFISELNGILNFNNIETKIYGNALVICKQQSVKNYYNYIYSNSNIFLERKKIKFPI